MNLNSLADWQSFYILTGSAAGALIGLQFVLMALIADLPSSPGMAMASEAFGTPNVLHFATSMVISAIMCAPWRDPAVPATVCGCLGIVGLVFLVGSAQLMRAQTNYTPQTEDWVFYIILPMLMYALLTGSGFAVGGGVTDGLYGLGAAAIGFVFIAIRNAWDSVTYHVFVQRPKMKHPKGA